MGKRAATTGQPGRARDHGVLPYNKPGSFVDGIRAQTSSSSAGEQAAAVRTTVAQLPAGDQAREAVGAPMAIGKRLENALEYSGRMESTVLLEEPETLDAELLQEEEAEAKAEAERRRPGLAMFTDGSRLDNGAAEYSVV